MAIQHIIYNSSQTNRGGRPGFGLRTATKGISEELVKQLTNDRDTFRFAYAIPGLTPDGLLKDPAKIEEFYPSYFFKLVTFGAEKAWVFGRKVAVGFDYMFYVNGSPTRLGNYVVDLYAFPEPPAREVFELMYENPAPGSVHFIPASPRPTADNEEMRLISVDSQADLEPESPKFNAAELPAVSPAAVELLFAFHDHLANSKPVAMKIHDAEGTRVFADFIRIIPENLLPEATFVSNYNAPGVPPGYAIAGLDPKPAAAFVPAMWIILDVAAGIPYASTEVDQLMPEFKKALDAGDVARVRNLAKWLFSEEYKAVKDLPASAREMAYFYTIESEEVTSEMISRIIADADAVKAVNRVIAIGHVDDKILKVDFARRLKAATTVPALKKVVDKLISLKEAGMDCAEQVLKEQSAHIAGVFFASPETFSQFYQLAEADSKAAPFAKYSQYLDLSALQTKYNHYLSGVSEAVWQKVYKMFFKPDAEVLKIAERTFSDKLSEATRSKVLAEKASKEEQMDIYLALYKTHPEWEEAILNHVHALQKEGITYKQSFFDFFGKHRDSKSLVKILAEEFATEKTNPDTTIDKIEAFSKSQNLTALVDDKKLTALFDALCKKVKAGGDAKAVEAHCDRIIALDLKSSKINDFKTLVALLNKDYSGNLERLRTLAVVTGSTSAIKDMLPMLAETELTKEALSQTVAYLLDNRIPRAEILAVVAKSSQLGKWVKAIYAGEAKINGATIVKELEAPGIDVQHDKAVEILQKCFPELYAKYLKSLEPSIFAKAVTWVKGLFAKAPKKVEKQKDTKAVEPKETEKPEKKQEKKQEKKNPAADKSSSGSGEKKPKRGLEILDQAGLNHKKRQVTSEDKANNEIKEEETAQDLPAKEERKDIPAEESTKELLVEEPVKELPAEAEVEELPALVDDDPKPMVDDTKQTEQEMENNGEINLL